MPWFECECLQNLDVIPISNLYLFQVTCLWTLQNLAASGSKPLQILKSQVIGPKLVHILKDSINEEIKSECFLLLNILLQKGKWDILEKE